MIDDCIYSFRRADEAKSEIHLPADMLERLSQRDVLDTVSSHYAGSTAYPVARVVGDDEKDFVLF